MVLGSRILQRRAPGAVGLRSSSTVACRRTMQGG